MQAPILLRSLPCWNNWQWQSRNCLRDLKTLGRVFPLSEDARGTITRHRDSLALGMTPS